MVLGIMDVGVNLDGIAQSLQSAVSTGIREAQSLFSTFVAKISDFVHWILRKIWEMLQIAYQKALNFLYDYMSLAKDDPRGFTLLTADMIILFGVW